MNKLSWIPEESNDIVENSLNKQNIVNGSDQWYALKSAMLNTMVNTVEKHLTEKGVYEDDPDYESKFRKEANSIILKRN